MTKFEQMKVKCEVLEELSNKITQYEKYWLNLEWEDSEDDCVVGGSDEDIEKYRICEDIRKQLEKMI